MILHARLQRKEMTLELHEAWSDNAVESQRGSLNKQEQ